MKSSTFGLAGVQKWNRQRAVVITLGVRDHRSHVRYLSRHMREESQENGTLILTYVGVVFKPPRLACEQTLHFAESREVTRGRLASLARHKWRAT